MRVGESGCNNGNSTKVDEGGNDIGIEILKEKHCGKFLSFMIQREFGEEVGENWLLQWEQQQG